jgi:hypothetical protein
VIPYKIIVPHVNQIYTLIQSFIHAKTVVLDIIIVIKFVYYVVNIVKHVILLKQIVQVAINQDYIDIMINN